MIKLYYTGANQYGRIQNNPELSLGGFMSSTVVPNQTVGNLFSEVSEKSLREERVELKAIFIKNELPIPISNLTICCIKSELSACNFQFSAVASTDQKSMERIQSSVENPYYADFFEANGVENAETLTEELLSGNILGLWIKRIILPKTTPPQDEQEYALWIAELQNQVEEVEIQISWD